MSNGGHCYEANIWVMLLIRLCQIRSCIPCSRGNKELEPGFTETNARVYWQYLSRNSIQPHFKVQHMVSYLLNRGLLPKQMINRAGRRSFPTFPQRAGSKIMENSKWSLKWSVIWGSQQKHHWMHPEINDWTRTHLTPRPASSGKKNAGDQVALSMETVKCVPQSKSHCLFKLPGSQRGSLMWERQISVRLCLLCTEQNSPAP